MYWSYVCLEIIPMWPRQVTVHLRPWYNRLLVTFTQPLSYLVSLSLPTHLLAIFLIVSMYILHTSLSYQAVSYLSMNPEVYKTVDPVGLPGLNPNWINSGYKPNYRSCWLKHHLVSSHIVSSSKIISKVLSSIFRSVLQFPTCLADS